MEKVILAGKDLTEKRVKKEIKKRGVFVRVILTQEKQEYFKYLRIYKDKVYDSKDLTSPINFAEIDSIEFLD